MTPAGPALLTTRKERYLLERQETELYDPFVGSGTTAVACQQMKRHFIAVESNPEYAQIAQSRLKTPEPEPTPPVGRR